MSKYDVNFKRLAVLLLPTVLRRPRLSALATVLMAPLSRMSLELKDYREAKAYRLRYNGQTCYLRAILNDRFDPDERRIEIREEESAILSPVACLRRDNSPLLVRNRGVDNQTLFFWRGLSGTNRIDFWVYVPESVRNGGNYSEAELKAMTNTFRLASKRYGITYF